MSEYFLQLRRFGGNGKVEKMQQELIHRNFSKMVDLTSLKSEIDKLDIGKLNATPVDLKKSSDVSRQRSC